MTYVTETIQAPQTGYRYMVELVSRTWTIDGELNKVPLETKTLDVVVAQAHPTAIVRLLKERGHLQGFKIARLWIPEEETAPF